MCRIATIVDVISCKNLSPRAVIMGWPDGHRHCWDRSWQELVQRGGAGRLGPGGPETPDATERVGELRPGSSALHRGDGGVLRRASSGPGICGSGARGPPDVAGICSPVCEGAEER